MPSPDMIDHHWGNSKRKEDLLENEQTAKKFYIAVAASVTASLVFMFIQQKLLPALLYTTVLLAAISLLMYGIILWFFHRRMRAIPAGHTISAPSVIALFVLFLAGTFSFILLGTALAPKIIPRSGYTIEIADRNVFNGYDWKTGQALPSLAAYPKNTGSMYFRLKYQNYYNPSNNLKLLTLWVAPSGATYNVPGTLGKSLVPRHGILDFPLAFQGDIPFEPGFWRTKLYGDGRFFGETIFYVKK